MGSWRDCSLGDVLTLQRGFDLPIQERTGGTVPVIASTGPVGWHNKAQVAGPGVVIGRSGSIGGGQFIRDDFWPLNTTLWVSDFKGNDRRFCYFLLRSIDFSQFNVGSGVPTLNRNHVHPLDVRVPDKAQQERIGELLGSLDDKIQLNRQMNETLEAMAQAIFRDWFVYFSPVRRKMEGETDPVAIMGGLTPNPGRAAELAALFPTKLGGDGRPDGWAMCRMDELLELVYGKALPKQSRRHGTVPVYGSGGVGGWHDTPLEKGPSIIVGRKGTVGSLFWEPGPFFAIDTAFYVRPRRRTPLTYLWPLLQSLGLEGMNTDAAVPGLNRANVYRLEVPAPPKLLVNAFDGVAGPLYRMLQHNDAESSALSETRDYLLPRLISGAVRIEGRE